MAEDTKRPTVARLDDDKVTTVNGVYIEGAVNFNGAVPKDVIIELMTVFRQVLNKVAEYYEGKARGTLHVAGINMVEQGSKEAIQDDVRRWYAENANKATEKDEVIH